MEMSNSKDNVLVGIVTGSTSDESLVSKITWIFDEFGIKWEHNVISAHRNPNKVTKYVKEASERGLQVLIGVAGLAAALPGVLASHTTLPVIGVPVDSGSLKGIDALYSMVQMPSGIPVATVGIGNSANAAYLAASILALKDKEIAEKLVKYRKSFNDINL